MPKDRRRRRRVARFALPAMLGLLAACAVVFVLTLEGVISPGPVYYTALVVYATIAVLATAASAS